MAEIAPAGIVLGVPIVREFDQRRLLRFGACDIIGRRQKHKGIAAFLVVDPANFTQTELVAVEVEGLIKVCDPHHGMEILHVELRANDTDAG